MDGVLSMFTKGGGDGGIMGMVRKFEAAVEDGQRAAIQSAQLQLQILAELRRIRELLERQQSPMQLSNMSVGNSAQPMQGTDNAAS
jgi:hypothetical protein